MQGHLNVALQSSQPLTMRTTENMFFRVLVLCFLSFLLFGCCCCCCSYLNNIPLQLSMFERKHFIDEVLLLFFRSIFSGIFRIWKFIIQIELEAKHFVILLFVVCGELFGMQQSQISQTYSNRFYGSFMLMQPDSFLAKKKLLSSSENGESGRVQRLRMRIVVAREWDQNAHIKPHKSTAYRILCAEWQNPLYAIFGWCLALIKVNPCSGSVSSGRQCWAKREKIFEYA